MTDAVAVARTRRMMIHAKVIRADGRVEDLGMICSSNPWLRAGIKIRDFFRGICQIVRR